MNPNGNPPFNQGMGNDPQIMQQINGFMGQNQGFNQGNNQQMNMNMNMNMNMQGNGMSNNNQQMSPDQTVFMGQGGGIPINGVGMNSQQGNGVPLNNQQQGLGMNMNFTGMGPGMNMNFAGMNMNGVGMGNPQWPWNLGWPYSMPFPSNPVPNPNPSTNQSQSSSSAVENWTIYFQSKDGQNMMLQLPSDKTVKEATISYRTKSGEAGGLKFSYNGKPLADNLTLSQSNLSNGATITVEKLSSSSKPQYNQTMQQQSQNNSMNKNNNFMPPREGYLNIIFDQKTQREGQSITVQISADKKVSDAINSFRSKMFIEGEMKFIFNGQNLDPNLSLSEAGLKNGARITVISTKDVEGA